MVAKESKAICIYVSFIHKIGKYPRGINLKSLTKRSYHITSYHIISYHIISYHIISYIILYIISYHIISYHIISYHIIPHHIIHTISYCATDSGNWFFDKKINIICMYSSVIVLHLSHFRNTVYQPCEIQTCIPMVPLCGVMVWVSSFHIVTVNLRPRPKSSLPYGFTKELKKIHCRVNLPSNNNIFISLIVWSRYNKINE